MIYAARILLAGLLALAPFVATSQEKAVGACDEVSVDDRGWTSLHTAARSNPNPGCVAKLIAAGADVNARNNSGDTPLHWAAAENPNIEVVEALLTAGADVNAKDKFGWQPIHTAAERSADPDVIATLIDAGSQRNKRAYFILFSPKFLLKRNDNMSDANKELALALLKTPESD